MILTAAILMVVQDQRQSYEDMTIEEAVAHARYTIHPDALDDSDPVSYDAYKLVLHADQSRVNDAVAELESRR